MRLLPLLPFLCAAAALADGGTALPMPVALAGRFHFPLLHFPIALLLGAALLDVGMRKQLDDSRRQAVGGLIVSVAAASAVLTVLAGLALGAGEDFHGREAQTFALHRGLGIAVAVLSVVLVVLNRSTRSRLRKAYAPSLWSTAVLVVVVGHLGGSLVHGDGYLLAPLSKQKADDESGTHAYVADADEPESGEARQRWPEGSIPDKPDYVKDIKPLFERSCVKCHGPEKRKSGLRLDQKRYAMKGGESGPVAIVPGDSQKSLVYTMSAKPGEDEDVMPSKGKLLSLSEIETLKRWIDQGAVWPE